MLAQHSRFARPTDSKPSRVGVREGRSETVEYLPRGARLAPHLMVRDFVGEGAFAVVYSALDARRRELVAAKVARKSSPLGLSALLPFEAELCRMAESPHTPVIHDIGRLADGRPYYTMELFDAPSIAELLALNRFDVEEALEIASALLTALTYIHRVGILHRDIKPSNVLLLGGPNGVKHVKLIDFGISESPVVPSSVCDMVLGTPEFMAPEQLASESLDGRCDLYAVGALLYAMVAVRPPHVGATPREVARAAREDEPLPLSFFAPDCPAEVDALVSKALAKDRNDRYPSAQAMRQSIDDVLAAMRGSRGPSARGSRVLTKARRPPTDPHVGHPANERSSSDAPTTPFPLMRTAPIPLMRTATFRPTGSST